MEKQVNIPKKKHETLTTNTIGPKNIEALDADKLKSFVLELSDKVSRNEVLGEDLRSPEIIRAVFSKYFSLFGMIKNFQGKEMQIKRPFSDSTRVDMFEINTLLPAFNGNSDIQEGDRDSFQERVFREVMNLAHKYPDQVFSIWEIFWQTHGESSRTEVILESLIGLVKDKKCVDLVSRVNFDMQYFYSFRDQEESKEVFEKHLDFENEEKFGDTASFLELLRRTCQNLDGYAESSGVAIMVRSLLEEVQNKPGSYLLCSRAQELLAILDGKQSDSKETVFQLAPGISGVFNKTGLAIFDGNSSRDLSTTDVLYSKEHSNFDDQLFDFELLQRPYMRKRIEDEFNLKLSSLSLPEQFQFLNFIKSKSSMDFDVLKNQGKKFGSDFYHTFLSIEHGGIEMGKKILTLGEKLPENIAKEIFRTYSSHVEKVFIIAENVLVDLKQEFPNLSIDQNVVESSLLIRAKDFLSEIEKECESNPQQAELLAQKFIVELLKESPQEQVIRAQFKTIATLLDGQNINLKTFEKNQDLLLHSLVTGEQKALVFRTLHRMGKLNPVPEIHWRVDRSTLEYNRRLGIDINALLVEKAQNQNRKQILLEIGPGSGVAKSERREFNEQYQDVALSDKIYYPLDSIIEKVIDFSRLEKEVEQKLGSEVVFSEQEKRQLADFIYKILVITPGETTQDEFTYDIQNQKLLTEDINNLKTIFHDQLGTRLTKTNEVPDTISVHSNGKVLYPNKISTQTWPEKLQVAKQLFETASTEYFKTGWEQADYYSYIDAFPANVMIGDISQISRLQENQVDVELGVRSSVYKKEKEYVQFLGQLFNKLNQGGVAIDDSIRDNDGWYYRIAEALEAKKQAGIPLEVLVVLGPGFAGEDKRQDKVPLSIIITKDGTSQELVSKNLRPGCELTTLEVLAANTEYLASLDTTGLTLQKVQEYSSNK